jgi:serine/threonine protein kinase
VRPGSNFGPYRVLEPLGRGGMAAVYRAYEPSLDRYVALKVLPAESLAEPAFTARFRREAKVIAGLEHRSIVPIYAYGIDEGVPWMAMRLVPGGTVAGELRGGAIALPRTSQILTEVAAALDFAHRRGVLHRDVKPQNVLLDEQGHAYLADFGVARMMEGTSAVTRSGVVTGTPLYMSPEQARGDPVDHRTDIYALGIVAYEMVTGNVPFTADTPVAVLMKHILEPFPLPPSSQMPEPVLRAVLKCVAKDRNERWQNAGLFAQAMRNAVRDVRSSDSWLSAQATQTRLSWPSPARRMPLRMLGLGVLLLCALGVLYVGLAPREESKRSGVSPAVVPPSGGGALPAHPALPVAPTSQAGPLTSPAEVPRPRLFPPRPSPSPSARVMEPGTPRAVPASGIPPTASRADAVPEPTRTDAADPGLPAAPAPPPPVSAAPAADATVDGVSFLIGRWKGTVRHRKNPFIRRELERSVNTECKRLSDPSRVFCRNDWGIVDDWLVVRHDPYANRYWYEDSEGQKGSASAEGDALVYHGTRAFEGRSVSWRLTHVNRGPDSFEIQMDWSRDAREWHTIYDASFGRLP